jgi:hypothetical protein
MLLQAPSLSKLSLRFVEIENSELEIICEAVATSTALLEFEFTHDQSAQRPSNVDMMCSKVLERNRSLSSLRWLIDQREQVSNSIFESASLATIFHLDLSFSIIFDVTALCETIKTNKCLSKLSLAGLDTGTSGFHEIFTALEESNIDSLDIFSMGLKKKDLPALESFLQNTKQLKSFDFGSTESYSLEEEVSKALLLETVFNALPSHSPISDFYFMGYKAKLEKNHVQRLFNMKNLRCAILADTKLPKEVAEIVGSKLLEKDCLLEELSFPRCTWDQEDNIADILLSQSPSCRLRSLTFGLVSSSTAGQLFEQLPSNENLGQFAIECKLNPFEQDAFSALVQTIKFNKTLRAIYAGQYVPTVSVLTEQLKQALEENISLNHLSLSPRHYSTAPLERNSKNFMILRKMVTLFAIQQFKATNLDKYVVQLIFRMASLM